MVTIVQLYTLDKSSYVTIQNMKMNLKRFKTYAGWNANSNAVFLINGNSGS